MRRKERGKQAREEAELGMGSGKLSLDPGAVRGLWTVHPTAESSPPEERASGFELPYQSVVGFRPAHGQEGWQEGVGDSYPIKVNSPGAAISHEHPVFIAAREWVSPGKGDMGRAPIPPTELLVPGNKGGSTSNPDQSCDHPIPENSLALNPFRTRWPHTTQTNVAPMCRPAATAHSLWESRGPIPVSAAGPA